MKNNIKQHTAEPETAKPARILSPDRAFVVHFHPAASANEPPCAGRVEHVSSGSAGHFESWPELTEFVRIVAAPQKKSTKE